VIFRDGAFLFYFLVFKFPAKILDKCRRVWEGSSSLFIFGEKTHSLTATVNIDRLLIEFFFLFPRPRYLTRSVRVRVTPRHITRTFHSALLLFADDQKKRWFTLEIVGVDLVAVVIVYRHLPCLVLLWLVEFKVRAVSVTAPNRHCGNSNHNSR
jgi:hypothetical protein